MNDQNDHVFRLLQDLASGLPEGFHEKIVIFGSAAMLLNGVEMKRPVDDLDVFVSSDTFEELRGRFDEETASATEGGSIPKIVIGDKIEAFESFPGIEFSEAFCGSKILPNTGPFRVASLQHLQQWKKAQNRPKDREDLKAIERRLAELEEEGEE